MTPDEAAEVFRGELKKTPIFRRADNELALHRKTRGQAVSEMEELGDVDACIRMQIGDPVFSRSTKVKREILYGVTLRSNVGAGHDRRIHDFFAALDVARS